MTLLVLNKKAGVDGQDTMTIVAPAPMHNIHIEVTGDEWAGEFISLKIPGEKDHITIDHEQWDLFLQALVRLGFLHPEVRQNESIDVG